MDGEVTYCTGTERAKLLQEQNNIKKQTRRAEQLYIHRKELMTKLRRAVQKDD